MTTREKLLPPRTPGLEINTAEAHSQLQSPLFRLPAELRQQIYEYVIGSGQIHVILRSCTEFESPIYRLATRQCKSPGPRYLYDYQKLTYSTCRSPSSFQTRYALSKAPSEIPVMYYNSRGALPHFPPPEMKGIILPQWGTEHGECYSAAQKDMVLQNYASVVCDTVYERPTYHRTHPRDRFMTCRFCTLLREDVEKVYGPPTAKQGLKKFHAESAVHFSALLKSCRRIYGEARVLPFQLYSFDVDQQYLQMMLENWLEPWQHAAIERLHISSIGHQDCLEALAVIGNLMHGLKGLEIDAAQYPMIDWDRDQIPSTWEKKIEKVKVVIDCDKDWRSSREERRRVAEVLENLLRKA